MDITWYGHSCFRIAERNRLTIITDPFGDQLGLGAPRLKGEIVTISHNASGHNNVESVKGLQHVIDRSGEYEVGEVFIIGIAMHNIDETSARENIVYLLEYDGLTVAHLGDLAHVPDQSTIEALGQVNVLLVPVGGGGALQASQAVEVIALIEPQYVVPMHYALPGLSLELDPVDKFLKAMGVSKVVEDDLLKVSQGVLPEQTQVVVLRPQA